MGLCEAVIHIDIGRRIIFARDNTGLTQEGMDMLSSAEVDVILLFWQLSMDMQKTFPFLPEVSLRVQDCFKGLG